MLTYFHPSLIFLSLCFKTVLFYVKRAEVQSSIFSNSMSVMVHKHNEHPINKGKLVLAPNNKWLFQRLIF